MADSLAVLFRRQASSGQHEEAPPSGLK